MFNHMETADWGIGTSPQYAGRKVSVVGVEGNWRQVSWNIPGEKEPTKHWVDVTELTAMPGTPIPPKAGPTPSQIDPAKIAEPESLPDGEADASVAKVHLDAAGVAADAAAEVEAAQIAGQEMDLAKQRDQLKAELDRLRQDMTKQTQDYDEKLKAQLEISNVLIRDLEEERRLNKQMASALESKQKNNTWLNNALDRHTKEWVKCVDEQMAEIATLNLTIQTQREQLEQLQQARKQSSGKPQRPRTETLIFYKVADGSYDAIHLAVDLQALFDQGWEIVYEVHQKSDPGHPATYFARLTRPVQETAHPPLEVKRTEAQPVAPIEATDWPVAQPQKTPDPVQEPVLEAGGLDDMDGDETPDLTQQALADLQGEPAWKKETDPAKRSEMLYQERKKTLGQKGAGHKIAEERARAKRQREQGGAVNPDVVYLVNTPPPEIPNGVQVGRLTLDPKQFPIAATIATFGMEATREALNRRIYDKAEEAAVAFRGRMANFRKLPPTLGASS